MMKKMLSIFVFACMVISGLIGVVSLFSMTITAPDPQELPDLTISQQNITVLPATPLAGEVVTINATIWNIGNADATNVDVNFYDESNLIGSDNVDIPILKTWKNYTVMSDGDVGYYTSIALDGEKGVHISHCDYKNKDLEYAYKPMGDNWTFHTVDYVGEVGMHSSIAVDNLGGVHIAYDDLPNRNLKYAYKPNGGTWSIPSVIASGYEPSITLDGADGIHISYKEYVIDDLKYAYKPNGGTWSIQKVDNRTEESSIAVDSENGIHISYYAGGAELKYALKPYGEEWSNYTLDSSTGGMEPSIAVDSENGIHISYINSWGGLKYANKSQNGSWDIQTIDPQGYPGHPSSIAIDSKNGIHISYYEDTNQVLKYAFKPKVGNWSIQQLDSPYTGYASSIAVDSNDNVHISYQDYKDYNNYDLKYANLFTPPGNIQTSISWTPTTSGLRNITVKIDENNEIEELNETNNNATVDVVVEPGPLVSIEVIPSSAILELGDTLQFNATGYDAYGNEVSISPIWDVSGGGTIDQSGLFTAKYPGIWVVYANQSDISGSATVTVQVNDTADTDSDGMLDWWEVKYDLDPFDPLDNLLDPDLDGLTNLQEFLNYSKPYMNDTDGDNLGDGFEVIFSKTNASLWDTNGNGIGDGLEFIRNKGYLGWIESLPDDWIGMIISWENYTIYIKTNSSVLEGEFDKEEQKLKIKVSGPNGTLGVTEIDVPKSLCEPEDIEIKLDGELINYTITEDDTYYYIHIEYNHSTHELTAKFAHYDEGPTGSDDEEGLPVQYLIAVISIVILIIIILLVVTRIRNGFQNNEIPELPPEELSKMLEEKYADGEMTDETYNDIKSLLDNYGNSEEKTLKN